jgi:uncharacterized protein YjiS (DUF1127 family)
MAYVHVLSSNRASAAPQLGDGFRDAFRAIRGWMLLRRTEKALAALNQRQLHDIGLVTAELPKSLRRAVMAGRHFR